MKLYLIFFTLLCPSLLVAKVKFDTSVEQFFQEIKKSKVKDVVSAVQLLDDKFFDRDQYAILFRSMSIQPSSYKFPRVLFFGKNKNLRIGINHHLGEKRNIDILQFREKEKAWELREIRFNKGIVSISGPNPSLCISCHGNKEIIPSFKGKFIQRNEYATDALRGIKKPDISSFKTVMTKDPIYSKLKGLNKYLSDLGF